MLERTSSARVGSGVIRAFQFDPRNLAQHAADLQRIYDRRFILGLGGGTKYMNINTLGRDFPNPASHIRELIRFLRHAWSVPGDERLSFNGTVRPGGGAGAPPPGQRSRRGRLGADLPRGRQRGDAPARRRSLRRTLRPPDRLRALHRGACLAARRRGAETIGAHGGRTSTTRAGSPSRSRATAGRLCYELKVHVARFMATRSYSVVLDSQGYGDVRERIRDAFVNHPDDSDALAAAIPDEVAAEHGLYGTPDDVAEQAQRYEGVIDTLCFYSASKHHGQRARAREPGVRDRGARPAVAS